MTLRAGLLATLTAGAFAFSALAADALRPIDLSGFGSGIHHWRDLRDTSRFIQVETGQPAYAPEQVREIVANILLFQRSNGGWPKDYDMTAVLTAAQRATVITTHRNSDSSYDNGNIHSQVIYLARAYTQSGDAEWRAACERGLDYILASQYANGGFPQRHPGAKGYAAHITFNDGVMMGCMNLLQDVLVRTAEFSWVDDKRRARAGDAVKRGVECILKTQISVNGARTGWCQQHDERTFEARPARTFELASNCPQETTEIVRFLMRIESPSPAVVESVEAAVGWMNRVKQSGVRVARVQAPKEEFLRHTTDMDVVVQADPAAPPLWARHHEIETDRPIFAGRDGVKKYALAEIERERRTGTAWYGGWPQRLIDKEVPAWRKRIAEGTQR